MALRLTDGSSWTSPSAQSIRSPILILHAHNDPVIPLSHTRTLAEQLLGPLLSQHAESEQDEALKAARGKLVKETKAGGWGVVSRFERGDGKGEVVWAEVSRRSRLRASLSPCD